MTKAFVTGLILLGAGLALSVGYGSGIDLPGSVVWELRVPRALLAVGVGASLTLAGIVLQALFSNPLCEPYTLGVSSGAAFGAVLGGAMGLSFQAGGMAGSAFLGAALFTGVLYTLARKLRDHGQGLLLSGVMLGFLGSSLVSLVMATSDGQGVQSALHWLLGDLTRARFSSAAASLAVALLGALALMTKSRVLDTFLLGQEGALSLGTDVSRERAWMLLLSSLLVSLCVSSAGMIGFVGLMVPHAVRVLVGSRHSRVIPVGLIWGAATLVWSDLLAKNVIRPNEVPVGVVTSLLGAPLFLWMMLRGHGERSS
jgi:iron complex transport system permease protein